MRPPAKVYVCAGGRGQNSLRPIHAVALSMLLMINTGVNVAHVRTLL
jgi:hypothetical protein